MIIIFITTILFILFSSLMVIKLLKSTKMDNSEIKNFSILISLKNEGYNIHKLFESLKKLNYNKNNYEIILIDDNSTDHTLEILNDLVQNQSNFTVISANNKKYPAKKGALDIGLSIAKHEYILITDADCSVPNNWISFYNQAFENNYDLIFSPAPFIINNSRVNRFSCFENLRTYLMTFFAQTIGLPYSSAARNIGFKKSFYYNIEGFSKMLETLSGDDDLLIREAICHKAKIGIINNNQCYVYSNTKNTLSDFLKQKFRHTSTSYHYSLKQLIFPSFWHFINIIMFFSILFIPINIIFIIPFLLKLVIDIFVNKVFQKQFQYDFSYIELVYFQILYELFIILKFPISYFYKNKW